MRLPIDTTAMTFTAATPPSLVTEYQSDRPKADKNGVPLYALKVVATADGEVEVIDVKCPGEPQGVTVGAPLRLVGLYVRYYSIDDRSGIAFRAARVEPAAAGARPAEARDKP
jgi:hypothetical protein